MAAIASRERPSGQSSDERIDELLELAYTRRRFLRDSAAATAAVVVAGCTRAETPPPASQTPSGPTGPQAPRIAIVGAGVSGLNAAYKLKQAGLTATIFEGASRTGGRMFTAKDLLADGLTTELGGEFIDSNHVEVLNLMTEFGLERLDTRAPEAVSLKAETYFINGRHYTHAQAIRAFVPIAKRLFEDYDALGEVVDYKTEGGGSKLDRQTITQYLDGVGVTGWMRELIDVAYVTEYGLESSEQSALNFLFLIGTGDLEDADTFALLGESDERYKVRGGNQQIVDELARRVQPQIRPLHRLEAIRTKGQGYTLTFQNEGKAVDARRGRRCAHRALLDPSRRRRCRSNCRSSRHGRFASWATARTQRCWSDSAAGRGRNWDTPGRPTATRCSSSRGPTACCSPGRPAA